MNSINPIRFIKGRGRTAAFVLFIFSSALVSKANTTNTISAGQTTNDVIALGQTNFYAFTGTSNDAATIFMVKGGGGFNPLIDLYDPDGIRVTYAVGNNGSQSSIIQAQKLTKTGTYTILCRDDVGDETYPYSLTLAKIPGGSNLTDPGDAAGTILPGQTLSNSFALSADIDTFTFAGSSNDAVTIFMVKGGGGFNPLIDLYDPDGIRVTYAVGNNGSQSSIIQAQKLTKTGTYTILCRDDVGDETYPYSLTLAKIPGGSNLTDPGDAAGTILPGQTLSNSFALSADIDTFTFAGSSNDAVTIFMVKGGGGFNPLIDLYDPDGIRVTYAVGNNGSQSSIIQAQKLTKTGTYTILCRDDVGNETYPYSLTMIKNPGPNAVDLGDSGPSIQPGQSLTNNIGTPSDIDALSFYVIAGDTVTISMVKLGGSGNNPYLQIQSPDGTVLANATGLTSATVHLDCLAQTGNYLAICRDDGGNETFSYSLSLSQSPVELPSSGTTQYLTIYTCSAQNAYLRWNTNATGFALETTTNLTLPVWLAVTKPAYTIADHFYVNIGFPTNQSAFYRLICTNGVCG